ncbi:MAG: ABC transporter ATP-binding protein, partial [Bacteroidota bacterium]|nr:ABC transporter ATP-binding protein [Bacteroidota bacterium]
LMQELNKQGHTIIMASHLLDEVEKVCTHVAILKKGELLSIGHVNDVLADDDLIELGSNDNQELAKILFAYAPDAQLTTSGDKVLLTLPRGTANLQDINAWCFNKGIVLKHLAQKKKRLEAKFFELTNN